MLPDSDLRTPGCNCVLMFHKPSKTGCIFAAPPQHDVALPCCTPPVACSASFTCVFKARNLFLEVLLHFLITLLCQPTCEYCSASCVSLTVAVRHLSLLLSLICPSRTRRLSRKLWLSQTIWRIFASTSNSSVSCCSKISICCYNFATASSLKSVSQGYVSRRCYCPSHRTDFLSSAGSPCFADCSLSSRRKFISRTTRLIKLGACG